MLLLFGPSPLRPLEVYDITLDAAPEHLSTATADSSDLSRSLVRRVLRELISSADDTSEGGALRGNHGSLLSSTTFACILHKADCGHKCCAGAGATRVFVVLPGKPGSDPPPGFRRKPGFQLRLRRALHVRRFRAAQRPGQLYTVLPDGMREPQARLASQSTAPRCKLLHAELLMPGPGPCQVA